MTRQHRKILLICIGVVVASYIVRSIAIDAMRMAYYQQQAIQRQQAQQRKQAQAKAKPKPAPPASKTPAAAANPEAPGIARGPAPARIRPKPAPPSPFAKISGVWRGRTAIDDRGICDLKFELKEEQESHFSGYSSMTCVASGQLMAGKKINARTLTLNRMDPEAAIFSGAVDRGSIELHADKVVGSDSNGCAPTSFSLTPFGANQLAAEWQEAACAGGKMILRKARQ